MASHLNGLRFRYVVPSCNAWHISTVQQAYLSVVKAEAAAVLAVAAKRLHVLQNQLLSCS